MRHGKAMYEAIDWERCLAVEGQDDVRWTSIAILNQRDCLPQWILCSAAKRTQQTLEIFSEFYLNKKCQIFLDPSLYLSRFNDLRTLVAKTPPEVENLMIIGHNPVLSEFVSRLVKDSIVLGSANAAILQSSVLESEWQSVLYEPWELSALLKPESN